MTSTSPEASGLYFAMLSATAAGGYVEECGALIDAALAKAREAAAATALANQANLVGFTIDQGRLDGANGAAVAAAIRATTPEAFAEACATPKPEPDHAEVAR